MCGNSLIRFLRDLPEPILDQRLWRLYTTTILDSPRSLSAQIGSARTILRLLPPANFSLLVYLLAFLAQLSLVSPARLTVEQIAVIFGPAIFSARVNGSNDIPTTGSVFGTVEEIGSTKVTVKKAQDALEWLLLHWTEVSRHLLEPTNNEAEKDFAPVVKPLPTVRYQPKSQLSAPHLLEKSFRRRSSLPIFTLDLSNLSTIERRKSSLPRIEDTSQFISDGVAPYSKDNFNPQSFLPNNTEATMGRSPKSTVHRPWLNEDRRREELGLIPRTSISGGEFRGERYEEGRGESSLDSDGMISSTRSWGSTAPSSTEPNSKDHYCWSFNFLFSLIGR